MLEHKRIKQNLSLDELKWDGEQSVSLFESKYSTNSKYMFTIIVEAINQQYRSILFRIAPKGATSVYYCEFKSTKEAAIKSALEGIFANDQYSGMYAAFHLK